MKQKNTHDIPNYLKTCKSFFCEKTDHPPVTLTYLRNSRGQAHQCSRGHKNFGSKLCWTKCAPISKKKDVCGVENWRIIYYFQSLKNCPMTCTPYMASKKSRGEEIGERGILVEFWTSYNYYCCSPKMKEKNEIVVLGVSQSELSNL